MKPIGLYLHIPFCDGKCPYCDFYSLEGDTVLKQKYTKCLLSGIERYASKINNAYARTLYIGGGTPNMLGIDNLEKVVRQAIKSFYIDDSAEKTVEINPTRGKGINFEKLVSAGINRISIGLQSANENELKILGRKHTASDVAKTVKLAQEAGISNISLDLMLGISEQTEDSLNYSIEFCQMLDIQHISLYMLKIEQGTPYFINRDKLNFPEDDAVAELYLNACDQLQMLGFNQYEISNFCIPGYESKHNLLYWNQEEYLGIGPSAHSFINGQRFYFERDLEQFLSNSWKTRYEENFSIEDNSKEEYLMLRLRLSEGIIFSQYERKFNERMSDELILKMRQLCKEEFAISDFTNFFRLTPKGFLISNAIIADLLCWK